VQNVAKFQEVVTIPEESLKSKIHTTFRLGYVKDAVLPRALDDMTMAALHSMMMFNYMDILQSLSALPDYFAQIFRKIRACGRDSEDMELIVTYLQVRTVALLNVEPLASGLRGRSTWTSQSDLTWCPKNHRPKWYSI
jgi:hypothetical protein